MPHLASGVRVLACLALLVPHLLHAADPWRVLPEGQKLEDVRLKPQRTLNDKYHPWTPPASKQAWEQEADRIRRQILVSNGLWPLPEKTPLNPVIHGKSDRGDYTVEKVFFASRPGVYVTGSLYRPKKAEGKSPAVLCPHGHWKDGRFYDAGEKGAAEQFKLGAESYLSGARSPLQARMVQLTRMGCVVFFYDMVGIADNTALPHREGFNDVAAELWLQNKMGLQTWNSIRALDFVASLPDVDPERIGVTGASGGGTQTFMLCAVDPRPAVAFPAVMVGTAMQGGCQCENASYLRLDINNIAIAALMAPRPMAMTGANDWTIDIESKGLPELKAIYGYYGKPENVSATCLPQFPHNYNEPSREVMFAWMAKHFGLKDAPTEQTDFWPMTQSELTVFDDKHPAPADWLNAEQLRTAMTKESKALIASLAPKDNASWDRYREVVGGALDVMIGPLPPVESLKVDWGRPDDQGIVRTVIRYDGRSVPLIALEPIPREPRGIVNSTVLWLDPSGKRHLFDETGKPKKGVQMLRSRGYRVASIDTFLTGEFLDGPQPQTYPVNAAFPTFTFGYNRPLLMERVRDTVVAGRALLDHTTGHSLHLVGTGDAGLIAALARTRVKIRPQANDLTIADLNNFSFADVTKPEDPMLLPGSLRYGDVDGLVALAAADGLKLHRAKETSLTKRAGARLQLDDQPLTDDSVVRAILGE